MGKTIAAGHLLFSKGAAQPIAMDEHDGFSFAVVFL